ncbi:MAG: hypothetical protein QF578_06780, partial [Alphaproteobacteria bacterium]|nr:hypothetical protein [Alphaproteobacteria bacterium]
MLPDHVAIESETDSSAARGLLAVLVLLVVGAVTWASLAEIDSIIVAQGKLATTAPNIVIQPIDTAVIRSIDVRVGDVVKKGQHLGHLVPHFVRSIASEQRLLKIGIAVNFRLGGSVPQTNFPVITDGDDAQAVVRESHQSDGTAVGGQSHP